MSANEREPTRDEWKVLYCLFRERSEELMLLRQISILGCVREYSEEIGERVNQTFAEFKYKWRLHEGRVINSLPQMSASTTV